MVGKREAIEAISEEYLSGGIDLVGILGSSHDDEKVEALANLEAAKVELSKCYRGAQRTIDRGYGRARASPISGLEKGWRERHDDLQSLIAKSMEADEDGEKEER